MTDRPLQHLRLALPGAVPACRTALPRVDRVAPEAARRPRRPIRRAMEEITLPTAMLAPVAAVLPAPAAMAKTGVTPALVTVWVPAAVVLVGDHPPRASMDSPAPATVVPGRMERPGEQATPAARAETA